MTEAFAPPLEREDIFDNPWDVRGKEMFEIKNILTCFQFLFPFFLGYDPNLLTGHLNKLFGNIRCLETTDNTQIYHVIGFHSHDGEYVQLEKVMVIFIRLVSVF